jgi:murein DD-endopeptidase MepM/ murein hydrolase activator NlpD
MIVPEREKGIKSFRIPRIFFRGFLFIAVMMLILVSILSYDYWQILQQVYKNNHLSIENRQLKEQIQLFQTQINSLAEDIKRISEFEKKLRIITGFEQTKDLTIPINPDIKTHDHRQLETDIEVAPSSSFKEAIKPAIRNTKQLKQPSKVSSSDFRWWDNFSDEKEYKQLKDLYEKKIASTFGLQSSYTYTKQWSEITQQSFALAGQYAEFDFKYNRVKGVINDLEVNIHNLDQYLLDKESFLKSTPTLLPTKGWITSYYGPRLSHYSGRVKMHEGLDIGASTGTPIISPADGIVTYSGQKPSFGKFVQIDHGYGIETVYAHNSTLKVKKGQRVNRGTLLATVGSTGYSTGPHLHYEVRVNGTPVDPLYFILD